MDYKFVQTPKTMYKMENWKCKYANWKTNITLMSWETPLSLAETDTSLTRQQDYKSEAQAQNLDT